MTDLTELSQQELAQLRDELSNQAIGSKDHLRKIALSLVDKLEKCRDREIRWLDLSDEKSKIITDQEEALEKAQQRIAELEEAEQKLCAANITLDVRAELAERQLAEMESRTVTVNLPDPPGPMSVGARTVYFGIVADVVGAFQDGLNAAGIKVEAE